MTTLEAVMAAAARYAGKVLRDDERVAIAIVLAWYYWHKAPDDKKELPASVWARCGVRAVMAGRDLPGVQPSHKMDAWDALDAWQGATMAEVKDKRPGPDKEVEDAEQYAAWWATLNDRQRRLVESVQDGMRGNEIAAELNVSQGRITQMRQEVANIWREM